MSVEYYLVCHECQTRIHVAQMGVGGWAFYSGERDCMKKLSVWFCEHLRDHPGHRFVMHDENTISSEDYYEIKWTPNHLSEPKDGR